MRTARPIIDDPATEGTDIGWRLVTDQVMGGVSEGGLAREMVHGRMARRMRGEVRLENDGGFVQMALDLAPDGRPVDASAYAGMELDVLGNGEAYGVHLRTGATMRPWQSYRQGFEAPPVWRTVRLAFADFRPHRIETPFDPRALRRIGVAAIGRAFAADLAVGGVRFFGGLERDGGGSAPRPRQGPRALEIPES